MSQILLSHIFGQTHCRTARLNSTLQFQVTLSDVSYQVPGLVLLQSTHQHLAP